ATEARENVPARAAYALLLECHTGSTEKLVITFLAPERKSPRAMEHGEASRTSTATLLGLIALAVLGPVSVCAQSDRPGDDSRNDSSADEELVVRGQDRKSTRLNSSHVK